MPSEEVDMRRICFAVALAAFSLAVWHPPLAAGQDTKTKTAAGTVKSVSASALTVTDKGGKDWMFTVDDKTKVVAKGAGTKSAKAGGKISITDVVGNGDQVSVTYHDMGGSMHAASVRVTTAAMKSVK
jgi:hypothetical protein